MTRCHLPGGRSSSFHGDIGRNVQPTLQGFARCVHPPPPHMGPRPIVDGCGPALAVHLLCHAWVNAVPLAGRFGALRQGWCLNLCLRTIAPARSGKVGLIFLSPLSFVSPEPTSAPPVPRVSASRSPPAVPRAPLLHPPRQHRCLPLRGHAVEAWAHNRPLRRASLPLPRPPLSASRCCRARVRYRVSVFLWLLMERDREKRRPQRRWRWSRLRLHQLPRRRDPIARSRVHELPPMGLHCQRLPRHRHPRHWKLRMVQRTVPSLSLAGQRARLCQKPLYHSRLVESPR